MAPTYACDGSGTAGGYRHGMGMRGLGVALLLALVGLAGGYAVADLTRSEPVSVAVARPVPASAPSIPVDPPKEFAPDIDYPPLLPDLAYRRHRLGTAPFAWTYLAPRGWTATVESLDEIRWRPADEVLTGGYSLRVKLSNEHKTRSAMVAQKIAAVQATYDDVEVLGRTEDELSFSYRDPGSDRQRFNTFRWFGVPGEDEAKFEMSVVGREVDRDGLEDLLERVSDGVAKLP
jgi:hypothetical protein